MRRVKSFLPWMLTLCLALAGAAQAGASTFARVDLDYLVAGNGLIVVGEAVGARSYWNEARTFILTDVRVSVSEVLKGSLDTREITVTLPGGQVGDLTSVVVGAANLAPGNSYVLFLRKGDLLGARDVHYVRDHSQGVFHLEIAGDGVRAVSQARWHELLPNPSGISDPVGGAEGMPVTRLIESVRELTGRERNAQEVQP
jgi:hypothetical protein